MRYIKLYENFTRPIISYDFDGVLHRSVKGLHPLDFIDYESWEPFEEMFDKMKEDAKEHDIVVVTARTSVGPVRNAVNAYIKMYDLPVKEVFYTDNAPKVATLMMIGAIKHYDDNPAMENELRGTGIDFELVDPKIFEGVVLSDETHKFYIEQINNMPKDRKLNIQGDFIVLYHGTNKKNYNAILKSGMIKQGTWLTEDIDTAKRYSRLAVSRESDMVVDTFIVYMGSLMSGDYFTTNEDLFFHSGRYVPKNYKF